mmetsp:Transcript_102040/g.329145  ORF Transcript_102040/g.329145 Transcript_102040/m.329145 type:complete len:287 (-) Transcript_102040:34-894(-)
MHNLRMLSGCWLRVQSSDSSVVATLHLFVQRRSPCTRRELAATSESHAHMALSCKLRSDSDMFELGVGHILRCGCRTNPAKHQVGELDADSSQQHLHLHAMSWSTHRCQGLRLADTFSWGVDSCLCDVDGLSTSHRPVVDGPCVEHVADPRIQPPVCLPQQDVPRKHFWWPDVFKLLGPERYKSNFVALRCHRAAVGRFVFCVFWIASLWSLGLGASTPDYYRRTIFEVVGARYLWKPHCLKYRFAMQLRPNYKHCSQLASYSTSEYSKVVSANLVVPGVPHVWGR